MSVKLNIGCWRKLLPGYINIDLNPPGEVRAWEGADNSQIKYLQANICDLPYIDGFVESILLEHVLEHLYFETAYEALWECHRVLQPKGKIRITIPDFQFWVKNFSEMMDSPLDWADMAYAILSPVRAGNMSEHRSLWWKENLSEMASRVGFKIDKIWTDNFRLLNCEAHKE